MRDFEYPFIQATNVTVTVGASAVVTVDTFTPRDYKFYTLFIPQEIPANTGTEPVVLDINGVTYPLIDRAGNVVTVGKLRGGFFSPFTGRIESARYRLQFGSNGLPTAIAHFVAVDGLRSLIYNGSAGAQSGNA